MGTGICKADGHSRERTSTTVSQTFTLPRFEQETKFAVSCGFVVLQPLHDFVLDHS
jgi:hypothetical protein